MGQRFRSAMRFIGKNTGEGLMDLDLAGGKSAIPTLLNSGPVEIVRKAA